MTNKKLLPFLAGLLLFTTVCGCQPEQAPDRKVKLITERECDFCPWGLTLFKRKARTQYFDPSGRLTMEVFHRTADFYGVKEYHYDKNAQLSYWKNYDVDGKDTSALVTATHFYAPDGWLEKIQQQSGKRLSRLTTYRYDSLGRKIREELSLFWGKGDTTRDFRQFAYDAQNRQTRWARVEASPATGWFYTYPTPNLQIRTVHNETGRVTHRNKRYLNARGQVVVDSLYVYDWHQKVPNDLYARDEYTYDDAGRLRKYYSRYYYMTDCGSGMKPGWYTHVIEYQYEYYE